MKKTFAHLLTLATLFFCRPVFANQFTSRLVKLQVQTNNAWTARLESTLITGNTITVRTTGVTVNIDYDIINISGQVIARGRLIVAGSPFEIINLKNINAGKYFMRMMAPNEKPLVLSFVKQ